MARPKKTERAKPGPKAGPPEERREDLVAIRCTAAWKAWLDETAKSERTTVAILIDQAVAEWATSRGKPKPPLR